MAALAASSEIHKPHYLPSTRFAPASSRKIALINEEIRVRVYFCKIEVRSVDAAPDEVEKG